MSETVVKRTRKPNKYTAWSKAADAAAKAQSAAARADGLAERAAEAAEKAEAAAAKAAKAKEQLPALVEAEQVAYSELQAELNARPTDTDELAAE